VGAAAQGSRLSAVLIGHSHTSAILDAAADQSEIRLTAPDLWALWPHCGYDLAEDRLDPDIARQVSHGTVVSALGGSVHAVLALMQHPVPFDFILPGLEHLPLIEGARIVPFDAMRELSIRELDRFHRYMLCVRVTAARRIFHVGQPPILEDDAVVLGDVPRDRMLAFFPDGTAVSPATLRWKLWRLTSDLTREFCEENDIHFLDCPAESMDERGFLRPQYYQEAFHGNAAYGALVLEQIKAVA
jgi:hypothetical protein